MKLTSLIFAALAALVISTAAAADARIGSALAVQPQFTFCVSTYEWCLVGCEDLRGYVADTFASWTDALAFFTTLSPLQRETARLLPLPQYERHIVVAYRELRNQRRAPDPSGSCPLGR